MDSPRLCSVSIHFANPVRCDRRYMCVEVFNKMTGNGWVLNKMDSNRKRTLGVSSVQSITVFEHVQKCPTDTEWIRQI